MCVDNYLNEALPQYDALAPRLCRSAVIGFAASLVRPPAVHVTNLPAALGMTPVP